MYVTSIDLNRQHPATVVEWRDLCRMHARVVDATVGMPDGPRTLWAQISPGRGRRVLVIRSTEPVTADRLPAGYARAMTTRPWVPPGPGRYRAVMVCSPVRRVKRTNPNSGKECSYRRPLMTREEQMEWLAKYLDPLINRLQLKVIDDRLMTGWHRDGLRVVHRLVTVQLRGEVTNPQRLREIVTKGFGPARAYGAGLSIWEKL